jgi:predicted metal-dependent peptidase
MSFDLNKHVHRLLMDEPFFAALSRRIDKRIDMSIPTAGVRVNPSTGHFEMIYNPDFFESLPDIEKKGVLKHEFYHLIFEHVTGRRPDGINPKAWNIATDLAINSHLVGELPEQCCMPGRKPFDQYEPGLSAEAYLNQLKKEMGDNGGEGNQSGSGSGDGSGGDEGDGQFDSHDGWDEVDGEVKEIAKERLKQSLKKAAEEAASNGWGSVTQDVRKDIMSRITTRVDWRKMLRYFVKTSQRAAKQSSIKHINKRYPYIHAGRKVNRTAKIAVAIDQSGSVTDDMLNAFFNELSKLAKYAEFTVIPFDDQVFENRIYTWKKGETRKWERVLCGGTNFDAPTDYVNRKGFDGMLVLTDLCAPKPKAAKCQRMWLTTKYYADRPYFSTSERIIAID